MRFLGFEKDDKLHKEGLAKLYSEIDLLEVVKQLRLTRFMASLLLSSSQRELIKFQKDYVLGIQKKSPKRVASAGSHRMRANSASQSASTQRVQPGALSGFGAFDPDGNEIDGKLFTNIVDQELLDMLDAVEDPIANFGTS